MIEIKNVSKTFKVDGKDFEALKNVSLKINDGDIYGIIGTKVNLLLYSVRAAQEKAHL